MRKKERTWEVNEGLYANQGEEARAFLVLSICLKGVANPVKQDEGNDDDGSNDHPEGFARGDLLAGDVVAAVGTDLSLFINGLVAVGAGDGVDGVFAGIGVGCIGGFGIV